MKTKKGIVISWYFPPINSSEGICTFKLLKNSKYNYDVFTQKNNKNWSYDTNEIKLTSKNINPIYSNESNINNWVKEGIKYVNNNIEDYDFIMSRSMAPESHEIALEIKRRYPNKLWIASFGDPIAKNPYLTITAKKSPFKVKGKGILSFPLSYVLSPKRILKNLFWEYRDKKYKRKSTRIYKDIKLQKEVLKECDIIIFNNKYQMEYMLKDYSENIKSKVLLLPHGYDVDFYDKVEKEYSKKFKISYLGHLDEIRTPKNFLSALVRLKENKPNLYKKLEIEIYGDMADKDKVMLIDKEINDVVKFKKPIKYLESLKVMQNSSLLLLIDANLGEVLPYNIFYAAKLADYIGSKSNIFGITMLDGPSADIIKKVGGIISSHSIDDIYNNLVMVLENKIEISNNDKEKEFDMKTIAKKYDEKIAERLG